MQILGMHVIHIFVSFWQTKELDCRNVSVVSALFPFTVLHRVSGKLLVREPKVLLLLGGDSAFLSHHRDAGSTRLWAQHWPQRSIPSLANEHQLKT